MDVSMPPLGPSAAPRAIPDLRPSADAAATIRIARPPAALALGEAPMVQPVSVTQSALVSRSLIDGADEALGPAAAGSRPGGPEAAQRVLKPFGVSMLPSGEREVPASPDGAPSEGPEPAADGADRP